MHTIDSIHLSRPALASILVGLSILCCPGIGRAQQNDVKPLLDRIDRLERDVNLLQRQVYRGTLPSGAPMPVSPPDAQASLSNEVRITQLEGEFRTLTGQLEEITYNIDQLKQRLDALSGDIDQRFSALGPGGKPRPGGTQRPPPPPPMVSEQTPDAPPPDDESGPTPLSGDDAPTRGPPPQGSGILGTLGGGGGTVAPLSAPPPPPQDQQQAAVAPTNLPSGTAQEQYNYAFGLLRRADYTDAERALKSFLQRYPNDDLAGNAQYWLGETYYVRKDYENAATAFALGYQKYPKNGKAPDNLLKLGMSLGNLGKKQEACSAFARLDRDFPTAPPNVKDRETNERQQVGCP